MIDAGKGMHKFGVIDAISNLCASGMKSYGNKPNSTYVIYIEHYFLRTITQ